MLKPTDIENEYDLYSRTCEDGSYMLEGVDFTVAYAPVAGIPSLCIITSIVSEEGLTLFLFIISNALMNTILPITTEIVYLSLPYLYLEWYKWNSQNIH